MTDELSPELGQLLEEMIALIVMGKGDIETDMERLVNQYGTDDVEWVLAGVRKHLENNNLISTLPHSLAEQTFPDTVLLADGKAPACPDDGFPLLLINGRLQCVAESLDRCIGGVPITNIIQQQQTTYYVFEDGHKLPLLCSCCNSPLELPDIAESRRNIRGKHLREMWIERQILENGREYDELVLAFVEEGQSSGTTINVSFETAVQLKHPKPAYSSPRKKRKKKQRR